MSGLIIDSDACRGCGICIKSCTYEALEMKDKKAKVNENCILCGMCIDSCPFDAIKIEKEKTNSIELDKYKDIWVFIEQNNGVIEAVSYELLSKARELSKERNCSVKAILLGENVGKDLDVLFAYGADKVYISEHEILKDNLEEVYLEFLDKVILDYKPEIFLFGATNFGRSIAPRIAARVKTGLTADCTILEIDEKSGLLNQTRPAFGGNLMAQIVCPEHRPQMATVRPGVMEAVKKETNAKEVINIDMPSIKEPSIKIIENIIEEKAESISDAEIIVSVGRGIGSQKNLALVEKLAELLGGKVGVSRPLVDIGWADQKNQIGQTGSIVAPKLLVTFGISGAIQHLAGISGAETIISINTDKDAAIFTVANYKVVGDCVEILKSMISKLEKKCEKEQAV